MTNEEKKEKEISTSASEEENQGKPGDSSEQEEKPEKSETTDYKAELEKEREERKAEQERYKAELAKTAKTAEQAGFNIQKLKERLKSEGIDIEAEEGLTGERVREIVQNEIQTQLGQFSESFKKETSEILRSLASGKDKAQPGGGGGQKAPKDEGTPRPVLSPEDESLIKLGGAEWDSKRVGWVYPKKSYEKEGRFIPFDPKRTGIGIGLPGSRPTPERSREQPKE